MECINMYFCEGVKHMKDWAQIILAVVLTGVVCWQGWLIKDLREQNATQEASINQLVDQQKKIVEIDTEQTAAILVLSDKVNGKK